MSGTAGLNPLPFRFFFREPGTAVARWMALLLLAAASSAWAGIGVETDFPGGSAEVESIDDARNFIRLSPEKFSDRDRGWRAWWYAKLTGLTPGQPFQLEVGPAPWATPDRASFSSDNRTWIHSEPGVRENQRCRYTITPDKSELWVAWGPPFLPADAEALVRDAAKKAPGATVFNLSLTREGRETPALRLAPTGGEGEGRIYGLWIHARQHAWEAGASWVGKGLLDWLVSGAPEAEALRRRADITFVPIMDIDNVFHGAGGKNEKPQDHNRDWTDQPHWPAVAAAQSRIREMNEAGRFDLYIDLHNPSAGDKFPYFYLAPRDLLSPVGVANLDRFLGLAKECITGPLRFQGKTIESGAAYDPKAWQAISKNWVATHCRDHVVSVTLETAWNTPASNAEGYETVGRQLGEALHRYFQTDPAAPKAP